MFFRFKNSSVLILWVFEVSVFVISKKIESEAITFKYCEGPSRIFVLASFVFGADLSS